MVRQHRNVGVRKKLINVGDHALDAAIFDRNFTKFFDSPKREDNSKIGAKSVDHVDVIEAVWIVDMPLLAGHIL